MEPDRRYRPGPRHTFPMGYDTDLGDRLREALAGDRGVTEKRMFGGLAFLIDGNMAVSARGHGGLMLRVDPADAEALIREPHAERCVIRGREMDGWLRIDDKALGTDAELQRWVDLGRARAKALPAK